jgi:hypothetical protein
VQKETAPQVSDHISLPRRFRLFFNVLMVVGALVIAKAAMHEFGAEFLTLNPLFPSVVAGAIFIIGFLLSSILSDYKEAERMPGEIRAAMEAIHDDMFFFSRNIPSLDIAEMRKILAGIVEALEKGLSAKEHFSHLEEAIALADRLSLPIAQLEQFHVAANHVVRLRGQQDILRRALFRISYIQRMQFVPSAYVLVQTLVCATLVILLCVKTEATMESALIFGFVSYMFIYALYLIDTLEQPFRKGLHSVDDVSIFLLRDFADKLGRANDEAR